MTELLSALRMMWTHPLGARNRVRTLRRFIRWQTGSRLLNHAVAMPFVNDTRLLVQSGMTGATGNLYVGLMEFEDMAFVLHLLRPGDGFVDAGANVGVYTILAASCGASVIALEPVPSTFELLLDNVNLNRFTDRVRAMNVGAAEGRGELTFTADTSPMDHVLVEGPGDSDNTVTVAVDSLDSLAGNMAPVMLKIDVEGFEAKVVRGAVRLLASESLLAVLVELNGLSARYGFTDREVHETLLGFGFSPAHYEPDKRELQRTEGHGTWGNTLYVRFTSELEARLRDAEKFAVLDLQL